MSDELKPCPLCGSEAMLIPADDESPAEVYCSCCWCSVIKSDTAGAIATWNARAERTCRFSLEEDREMLAEKAACGPGEFVTQDMPDLLWTCSACGEQYKNGLDALPGWLKHCPNCGAKVTDEEEVG